jgi:hypothetical protein
MWRGNGEVVEQLLRLGGGMELGVFGNEAVVKLNISSSTGSLLVAFELALVDVMTARLRPAPAPARPARPAPAPVRECSPSAHFIFTTKCTAVHLVEPPPGSERRAEAQYVDRPRRAHGAARPYKAHPDGDQGMMPCRALKSSVCGLDMKFSLRLQLILQVKLAHVEKRQRR